MAEAETTTTAPEPTWLNIAEACKYLGISEQTMFRWMRAGKVTYYKIGKSTRFKKKDLDLLVEKVVSRLEGEILSERCAVCGNSLLVEGKMTSIGNLYFKPRKTRFLVLAESMVPVAARCCPACGNIQMAADTTKLSRLLPDRPAGETDD